MHIVLSDLTKDRLARIVTVDELAGARVVDAMEAVENPQLLYLQDVDRLTVVSANLYGGFGAQVTAVLETVRPGTARQGSTMHAVFYGEMTESEGATARDTAHLWAANAGFAECAVSLRTLSFVEIATPVAAETAPKHAAWLLGASGQDGAAAGRAMRAVSRTSRLHGAHTLLCGDQPLSGDEMRPFAEADAVVTGFSLYGGAIPAYMLCHLRALSLLPQPRAHARLYALVCAAQTPKAGELALKRLEHFALRAGMAWGQGLVIGPHAIPASPDATIARAVRAALDMLALTLMRGQRGRNAWVASRLKALFARGPGAPVPRLCDPDLFKIG